MLGWATHVVCNERPEGKQAEDNRAMLKSELMRYSFYYERYAEHHKAEQFAATSQLQKKMNNVAEGFQQNGFDVGDMMFLGDACLQIRNSRRFLKWTYAHAYFMKLQPEQQKFFEFHQAQLEGTLERLSDITENTPWDIYLSKDSNRDFYDKRAQTISLTKVVHDFFAGLRDAMQSGALFSESALVTD